MIKWPNGFVDFFGKIKTNAKQITTGTIVAIDPSSGGSSLPGFAIFRAGELKRAGAVPIPKGLPIEKRLPLLYDWLTNMDITPQVLVMEAIGMSSTHAYLHWSIGASIAAVRAPIFLECPIMVWKLIAKADPDYAKGDEQDAICIGKAVILRAQEYLGEHS